ncbi:MAG: alanyl-tRNA editing protein [Candidatus Methanomethylophilaceae archaeon]|nr:alanyl-tRNA editing protein [Candidatus Methanomethylophilaceae archaeon]
MTDEIFRRDGYLFNFEAEVVSVEGDEVVLDTTAFYPGGGGQVCDTGSIRDRRVTDVHYKGKDIVHVVPGNDLAKGDMVWCSVDWDRRFDLMQGHTGEHLLFCSLKRQCPELTITKIYISPESKYVIVNQDLTWEQIRAALAFANQAIRDNLPVTKTIMDRDDPDLEKVRIKLDRIAEDEEISVVAIGDIDLSACSGIHVMETSELEFITVDRKVSAGKDGVAIHFKIGDAAKDAATALAISALEMIDTIGCKAEDSPRAVANMKHELELDRRLLKSASKDILSNAEPEDVNGCPVLAVVVPGGDRNALAEAAESIKSKGGVAALVSVGETLSVVLASGNKAVDCKAILGDCLKAFGGRGGGKPDFSQGGVPDASIAGDVITALKEAVSKALI